LVFVVICLFVICLVIICLLVCYVHMTIWCKTGALFVNFLWPAEPENRDRLFGDCRSHDPHPLKHFPPPWSAEEQQACFVVRDQRIGDAQRFPPQQSFRSRAMSAYPQKADIAECDWHVRFVPKADIGAMRRKTSLFDHLVGAH
jgi:hypothetical protein